MSSTLKIDTLTNDQLQGEFNHVSPSSDSPQSSSERMRKMKVRASSDGSSFSLQAIMTFICCYGRCCNDSLGQHLLSKCDVLLAGQLLSFLVACSGAAQATLSLDCRLRAPMFTIGLFYAGLAMLLVKVVRNKAGHHPVAATHELVEKHMGNQVVDGDARTAGTCESPVSEISLAVTTPPAQDTANRIPCEEDELAVSISPLLSFKFWEKTKTYFPIAFLDVYANYIVMRGFQYTTLTSVTLLDALAIPSALILSKFFLQRCYTRLHLLGVALCLFGIVLNVATDFRVDKLEPESLLVQQYPHMMLGDLFAAFGGILVGASNVVQEISVRTIGGPDEYLGMLGFWASVIAFVHCSLFERQEIVDFFFGSTDRSDTCKGSTVWWILAAYIVSSVARYVGTAQFLQYSEATFFNLSLLTGDIWSVIFSVAAQGILPQPLFYVALVGTVGGVIVYEMAPSPILEDMELDGRVAHSHIELGEFEISRHEAGSGDNTWSARHDDDSYDLHLQAVVIC